MRLAGLLANMISLPGSEWLAVDFPFTAGNSNIARTSSLYTHMHVMWIKVDSGRWLSPRNISFDRAHAHMRCDVLKTPAVEVCLYREGTLLSMSMQSNRPPHHRWLYIHLAAALTLPHALSECIWCSFSLCYIRHMNNSWFIATMHRTIQHVLVHTLLFKCQAHNSTAPFKSPHNTPNHTPLRHPAPHRRAFIRLNEFECIHFAARNGLSARCTRGTHTPKSVSANVSRSIRFPQQLFRNLFFLFWVQACCSITTMENI